MPIVNRFECYFYASWILLLSPMTLPAAVVANTYVDDEGRWLERPFFPNQSFVLSQLSIMRQHRTTAILLYYYYYLCKSSPYSLFHLHFTTHCASQKKRPLKGLNVETTLFFSSSDMRSFLKTFFYYHCCFFFPLLLRDTTTYEKKPLECKEVLCLLAQWDLVIY